jgi:hypothetical protein
MTLRALAAIAAGIGLGLGAGHALLRDPTLDRPPRAAETPTLAEPPDGDLRASPAAAAAHDTVAGASALHALVYAGSLHGREPIATDFELVTTATAASWEGVASADYAERDITVVVEAGPRRITVTRAEGRDATPADLAHALASADLRERRIDVRDAEQDVPVAALLVDARGRPLGPLPAAPVRLWLPAELGGWVVAPGYAAAPLRIWPQQVEARLRRSAWVTGRVSDPTSTGGRVCFHDFGDGVEPRRNDVADLDERGMFSLGPIPAGRKHLVFEGADACLANSSRSVLLHAGAQDLGTLALEPLRSLHLAFEQDDGKAFAGPLFVSIHVHGRGPAHGLPVTLHDVCNGRLTLPRFRGEAVAIAAWTAEGRLGTGPTGGLLAARTSAANPATIVLHAPGEVIAQVTTAPFGVPEGSVLLACPTPYHVARLALLCREDAVEQRVRRSAVASDGVVRFSSMWPGPTRLAVISAQGSVLCEGDLNVFPGGVSTATLAPRTTLAAIDVIGPPEGRRFALVHAQSGITLRALATPLPQRLLVEAGRFDVCPLDGKEPAASRSIEVPAGEVRALRLN